MIMLLVKQSWIILPYLMKVEYKEYQLIKELMFCSIRYLKFFWLKTLIKLKKIQTFSTLKKAILRNIKLITLLDIVQATILFIDDNPCLFSILIDTLTTFAIAIDKNKTCKNVVILRTPVWFV